MFPRLSHFLDFGILLLRLVVAVIFGTSGYHHLKSPEERSKSIGASKGFTIALGAAELAGALGVAASVLTQLAALGLILVMLGAIEIESLCLAHRILGARRQWDGTMT